MFNYGVLDEIMKIDDIISCNVSGIISDSDKDKLLERLNGKDYAEKCRRNWDYAKTILADNAILFNVDGHINFRIGTILYRINVSALGYGVEIGDCYTLKYKRKIKTYGRRSFKRFIEKLSEVDKDL